jgi:hypothetical protein
MPKTPVAAHASNSNSIDVSIKTTMRDLFETWGMTGIKVNLGFWEGNINRKDPDQAAAWEL